MGCCTTNFHTPNILIVGTYNLNQCAGVRIELLKEWLYKLKRVYSFKVWEQCNIEESDLIDKINVLEQWITVKEADSETCEYYDQLQSFQTIIVNIIKSGTSI